MSFLIMQNVRRKLVLRVVIKYVSSYINPAYNAIDAKLKAHDVD